MSGHKPKKNRRAVSTQVKQRLINRRVENDMQARGRDRGAHSHGTLGVYTTPMEKFSQAMLATGRRVASFSSGAVALVGKSLDPNWKNDRVYLGLFINPSRRY